MRRITKLLHINPVPIDDDENGIDIEANEAGREFLPLKVPQIVVNNDIEMEEPSDGLLPDDFDKKELDDIISKIPDSQCREVKPALLNRPSIETMENLVPAEIVTNAETLFSVFNQQLDGSLFTYLFLDGLEPMLDKRLRKSLGQYVRRKRPSTPTVLKSYPLAYRLA